MYFECKIAGAYLINIINCSQTKFSDYIISVVFLCDVNLIDFSSNAFNFWSTKIGETGNARRALSALRVLEPTSLLSVPFTKAVEDTNSRCEEWLLDVDPHPPVYYWCFAFQIIRIVLGCIFLRSVHSFW